MSEEKPSTSAGAIDPQIREFVRLLNEAYAAHGDARDVAHRREIAELVRAPWRSGGPEMAETREMEVGGVRLRLHRPVARMDSPVMLYIHGGGWVLFSIDSHDRLMREYASRAEIAVLGIDYSLAPEAKYPVAVDEVCAALTWIEEHGRGLGLDPSRIFVGGDSAGANLSVAASLKRREAGLAPLAGMVLSYGAFDPAQTASYDLYGGPDNILNGAEMDAFWEAYTDHPDQLRDPLVAPLRADLRGLPPAFVAIAECDILADANRAFAAKLRLAGVPVEEVTYRGATHSFLEAVSIAPLASRALDDQARWLRARCDALATVG